jgi:hypothetical protein
MKYEMFAQNMSSIPAGMASRPWLVHQDARPPVGHRGTKSFKSLQTCPCPNVKNTGTYAHTHDHRQPWLGHKLQADASKPWQARKAVFASRSQARMGACQLRRYLMITLLLVQTLL